ncbi:hypothetical protein BD310DRAFT_917911 [Dichomitus squalens]|uniref:Uncharacterized protein n=1 Tax=Dichomitus squalens TaxID=114155 RepID=A0A4Q9Q6N4_9APHY|nr:hypothetical protein BD310DRAFT_917911 [Dichomitus squalens]
MRPAARFARRGRWTSYLRWLLGVHRRRPEYLGPRTVLPDKSIDTGLYTDVLRYMIRSTHLTLSKTSPSHLTKPSYL